MQLSFKKDAGRPDAPLTLVDLDRGKQAILEQLHLPEDVARRLMELGFLPGGIVTAGRSAPGGDPRVFQVDGAEVALRRETAALITLRPLEPSGTPEPR